MISISYLHRRSSKFVTFIGIFQKSPFETGLLSAIGDLRLQLASSVRHKSILIYRKGKQRKRAVRSAFIMDSTAATTELIRSISKLDHMFS